MLVKPIMNLVTKYTDVGLGVRKWIKPANINGLKLATSPITDSFSSSLKKVNETFVSAKPELFSWVKQKHTLSINKIEPKSLVMVHRTNYFPQNGKILSTSDVTKNLTGVGEYRPTVHFALNKSVTEHLVGNEWNTMKYSIILPFESTVSSMPKSRIIGGIQDDFFLMGSVNLPKGSVILKQNASIPKEQLLVSEVFDGVKLVETSADDMVAATNLVIKKMGYTPYNEALQKYLGASAQEMELITSIPEVEFAEYFRQIGSNIESSRAQMKAAIKTLENFKDIYSPEDYSASLEAYSQNLVLCNIIEKYMQKFDVASCWQKFFDLEGFYNGLHNDTVWAKSEFAFTGLNVLSKGSKTSWIWEGTDYKVKFLDIFRNCKAKLPKDKDIDYDVDRVISIIKNSETPEVAEKEIAKQLNIRGMKPADRTSQFEKMGLDAESIAEIKYQQDHPEEFQLQMLLDII